MSGHVPEPWIDEGSYISGGTPGSDEVVPIYGDDNNRARVCACVNACQGMTDPAVEIAALRRAVEVLAKELDEKSMDQISDAVWADPVAAKAVREAGE